VDEGGTATLSCPSGQVIDSIAFASYGTPTGSCPNFSSSSCHASSSQSTVESACLNKQSCTVGANNGVFGDPCVGTYKKLVVAYSCVNPNAAQCAEVDEGGTATLSCPSGQIIGAIAFASYGTPTGSCPDFSSSSCHASSSKSTVESACLNKESCTVGANNGVFGDPCVGTYKKLAVAYSCQSPNAAQCAEVDEGGTATLSCPNGQNIGAIAFASYGTPTGSCPNFSSSSCHASSSKSVVEAACLNKQSCSVGANNGVFGDPCVGTYKKLAVVYSCGGITDSCPDDPDKTQPGVCGCGVPEGTCSGTGTDMPVFLLAGQSNMEGNIDRTLFDNLMYELGQGPTDNLQQRLKDRLRSMYDETLLTEEMAALETSELIRLNREGLVNETLSQPYSRVMCAWQQATPEPLALNCGNPFGPELILGHALGATAFSPTSLIKVAKGGTTLYTDWLPPSAASRTGRAVGPLYTQLSERIKSLQTNPASVHPNCATQKCRWAGFIWFQGENDVFDKNAGPVYEQNLKNFISDVRSEMGSAELPVIVVQIGAWAQSCDWEKNVAPAQQAVVAADPYARLVKTDDLNSFYHYDPAAQLIIGERVAKALIPMLK
jgi:hypothetical protein